MHNAEEFFSEKCEELNVEKRDITVPVTLSGIRVPHLCQTTISERVKEKGVMGFFKRLNPFGGTDSGYTYVQHTHILMIRLQSDSLSIIYFLLKEYSKSPLISLKRG